MLINLFNVNVYHVQVEKRRAIDVMGEERFVAKSVDNQNI